MRVNGSEIANEARKYIDVPFRHQGRGWDGLDCVGLVVVSIRALGVTDHDFLAYGRRPDGFQFMREFINAGLERKPVKTRAAGHLLIVPETTYPCHVAIMTSRDTIIHAHAPDKRVVETNLSEAWRMKAFGVMAWPEVDYG